MSRYFGRALNDAASLVHRPSVLKSQLPGVHAPALEGAINAPNDLHLELLTEGLATEPKLEGISLQFSRFLAEYLLPRFTAKKEAMLGT